MSCGLDLKSFTDASTITIINTFGQPIRAGDGTATAVYPAEGVVATDGIKYSIAYYVTLKLEKADGSPANLLAPAKTTLEWKGALGGLNNCATLSGSAMSGAKDPHTTTPYLPLSVNLKAAFCNLDQTSFLASDTGGSTTPFVFGVPKAGVVQIAVFDASASYSFVDPLLYVERAQWSTTPSVAIKYELPEKVENLVLISSENPSQAINQNAENVLGGAATASGIKFTLTSGHTATMTNVPTILPTEVDLKASAVSLAGPKDSAGKPLCAVVSHGQFRFAMMAHENLASSPAFGTLLTDLTSEAGAVQTLSLAQSALPTDILGDANFTFYVPFSSTLLAAGKDTLSPQNLLSGAPRSTLSLQDNTYYFFSLTLRAPEIDPAWQETDHFIVKTGSPSGVDPICLQIVGDRDSDHHITASDTNISYLEIGNWGNDTEKGVDGIDMITGVKNTNVSSFIDLDPRSFYVELFDYQHARSNSYGVGIGTLNGNTGNDAVDHNNAIIGTTTTRPIQFADFFDDMTQENAFIDTEASAVKARHYTTRSQLLVQESFGDDNPSGTSNPFAMLLTASANPDIKSDDLFQVNDQDPGSPGPVADDFAGDRTHKARVDSHVAVVFPYPPLLSLSGTVSPTDNVFSSGRYGSDIPVCERGPDERQTLTLRIFALMEPDEIVKTTVNGTDYYSKSGRFRDTSSALWGLLDSVNSSRTISSDYSGTPMPVLGLGSSPVTGRPDVGVQGAVVPDAYIQAEIERARMTWSAACIRIKVDNDTSNSGKPYVIDTEPQIPSTLPGTTTLPNCIINDNGYLDFTVGDDVNTPNGYTSYQQSQFDLMYDLKAPGGPVRAITPELWRGMPGIVELMKGKSQSSVTDLKTLDVFYVPPPFTWDYVPSPLTLSSTIQDQCMGFSRIEGIRPYLEKDDASALAYHPRQRTNGPDGVSAIASSAVWGEKTFLALMAFKMPQSRNLAHEIGHALTNASEHLTEPAIVFPSQQGTHPDISVSENRRIQLKFEQMAKKCRPSGLTGRSFAAQGNRILVECP